MNFQKNIHSKKQLSIVTLFLVLSIAIPLTALSPASAHTPGWTIVSYAYLSVAPNPAAAGQPAYVYMWIDLPLNGALVTNDIRRHDYKLTITAPDGENTTQTWATVEDTTGVQFYTFVPQVAGNYTLTFNYAGQNHTWSGAYLGDYYKPASVVTTLTVQDEPIPNALGGNAIPTEYWSRPINGQNTIWFSIASNWLNAPSIRSGATATGGAGYGRFQPDGVGPETSHIMWTKEIQDGGVVGGSNTMNLGEGYYTGSSYNPRFSNAIVMQGRLYYQEPYGNSGGGGAYVAVDLQTGTELWRINCSATGTAIVPTFGYLYGFEDGNQHGVLPNGLLIAPVSVTGLGTVWRAYDARTGVLTGMNLTNIPGGSAASATLAANQATGANALGPRGEILIYSIVNYGNTTVPQWYLNQWNSSKFTQLSAGQIGASNWYATATYNASLARMFDWNVSIPDLKGTGWNIARDTIAGDKLLLVQGNLGAGPRTESFGENITCINLNATANNQGRILWTKNYAQAPNNVTRVLIAADPISNTFVTEDKETLELNGFSLTDGSYLWTAQRPVVEWDTLREDTLHAYGNLYAAGYDGITYCWDLKTGELLWNNGRGGEGNSTNAGLNTVYGHYPCFIDVIADGKVYVGPTEHSPDQPLYKGAEYRCLNATTGEEIWKLGGIGTGMYVGQYDIVADGYFVYLNIYDMQIYTVGKGASKLTVDAPAAAITQGQSLLIRGTIADIAAGTTQKEQATRFPNGVPCVSDDSQQQWMQYIYQQAEKPTNITGVQISLSVIDANGNYRTIGTATSDASGTYSYQWTPDITGKYTVIASFAGSNAYYGSSAESSLAVDNAPATPTPQPTQPPSMADLYFVPGVIGIIVAIIAVGAVLLLALRKRP
jgi:outer membrane protein assembly factor BamB